MEGVTRRPVLKKDILSSLKVWEKAGIPRPKARLVVEEQLLPKEISSPRVWLPRQLFATLDELLPWCVHRRDYISAVAICLALWKTLRLNSFRKLVRRGFAMSRKEYTNHMIENRRILRMLIYTAEVVLATGKAAGQPLWEVIASLRDLHLSVRMSELAGVELAMLKCQAGKFNSALRLLKEPIDRRRGMNVAKVPRTTLHGLVLYLNWLRNYCKGANKLIEQQAAAARCKKHLAAARRKGPAAAAEAEPMGQAAPVGLLSTWEHVPRAWAQANTKQNFAESWSECERFWQLTIRYSFCNTTKVSYYLAHCYCIAGRMEHAALAGMTAAQAAPGDPDAVGLVVLMRGLVDAVEEQLRRLEVAATLPFGSAGAILGLRMGGVPRHCSLAKRRQLAEGEEDAAAEARKEARWRRRGVVGEEQVQAEEAGGGAVEDAEAEARKKAKRRRREAAEEQQEEGEEAGGGAARPGSAAALLAAAAAKRAGHPAEVEGGGTGRRSRRGPEEAAGVGPSSVVMSQQAAAAAPTSRVAATAAAPTSRVAAAATTTRRAARRASAARGDDHELVELQLQAVRSDPMCAAALAGLARSGDHCNSCALALLRGCLLHLDCCTSGMFSSPYEGEVWALLDSTMSRLSAAANAAQPGVVAADTALWRDQVEPELRERAQWWVSTVFSEPPVLCAVAAAAPVPDGALLTHLQQRARVAALMLGPRNFYTQHVMYEMHLLWQSLAQQRGAARQRREDEQRWRRRRQRQKMEVVSDEETAPSSDGDGKDEDAGEEEADATLGEDMAAVCASIDAVANAVERAQALVRQLAPPPPAAKPPPRPPGLPAQLLACLPASLRRQRQPSSVDDYEMTWAPWSPRNEDD